MATAEGTLPRSGRGRHRRYGLGLPAPPTDEEKKSYADRNIALIIRTSLASFGALLMSQARFVFLNPVLTWSFLPFLTFTVVYYVLSLTVNAGTRGFDQAAHVESVSAWHPASYPSLDVFLPVCGEPLTVLRNTWEHVAKLARAYPGTSAVYVLDDGTDARVRILAGDFRVQLDCAP